MPKIDFKGLKKAIKTTIITVTTLVALAGAIKWFGDYQADKNFKKLPKQQQVYVDSLLKSGSISQGKIRDNISLLINVKEELETIEKMISKREELHKSYKPKSAYEIDIFVTSGHVFSIVKGHLGLLSRRVDGITIFDTRELKAKIQDLQNRFPELERSIKEYEKKNVR